MPGSLWSYQSETHLFLFFETLPPPQLTSSHVLFVIICAVRPHFTAPSLIPIAAVSSLPQILARDISLGWTPSSWCGVTCRGWIWMCSKSLSSSSLAGSGLIMQWLEVTDSSFPICLPICLPFCLPFRLFFYASPLQALFSSLWWGWGKRLSV